MLTHPTWFNQGTSNPLVQQILCTPLESASNELHYQSIHLEIAPCIKRSGRWGPNVAASHSKMLSSLGSWTRKPSSGSSWTCRNSSCTTGTAVLVGLRAILAFYFNETTALALPDSGGSLRGNGCMHVLRVSFYKQFIILSSSSRRLIVTSCKLSETGSQGVRRPRDFPHPVVGLKICLLDLDQGGHATSLIWPIEGVEKAPWFDTSHHRSASGYTQSETLTGDNHDNNYIYTLLTVYPLWPDWLFSQAWSVFIVSTTHLLVQHLT